MGKSIWKYWELRHLSPAELLQYEQNLEEHKHYGLNKEQMEVLLKVMLTCDDTVVQSDTCNVCGTVGYRPPSIAAAVREKVQPLSWWRRAASAARGQSGQNELNNDDNPNVAIHLSNSDSSDSTLFIVMWMIVKWLCSSSSTPSSISQSCCEWY